jgi:hypothetical protein
MDFLLREPRLIGSAGDIPDGRSAEQSTGPESQLEMKCVAVRAGQAHASETRKKRAQTARSNLEPAPDSKTREIEKHFLMKI